MTIYDMKSYYVIYALLDSDEEIPVTSSQLAVELRVSGKTIQNIIAQIQEYCLENGIKVMSKSGNGFYAEIFDEKKAGVLQQELDIYFSKYFVNDEKNALLISAFCLYILNKDTPTTVDQLCELFYLSKTSIYSYISKAKIIFSRSKIVVINDSKRGISVQSGEHIRRLFVAFCIGSNGFQYDLKQIYGVNFNLFDKNPEYRTKLNYLLREYNISFDDEDYYVFLILISYSEFRYQRYKRMEKNELRHKRVGILKTLPVWNFVQRVAKMLHLSMGGDDVELAVIANFANTFNTNLEHISPEMTGDEAYEGICNLYVYLDECIKEIMPELCNIVIYESQLRKLAYRIYMLKHNDYYERGLSSTFVHLQTPNALTKYMARLLTAKITEYFGKMIHHRFSTSVCLFFQEILLMAEVLNKNVKVLIVSKNGKLFSKGIREWMYENLNPSPERIDVCSLYEIVDANLEDYNMILTDYKNINIPNYKDRIYYFKGPLNRNAAIFENYMNVCYERKIDLDKLISRFDNIFIYRNADINNTNEFIIRLDNDLDGFGKIPIHKIRKLGCPINYITKHDYLVVPYLYREKEEHKNILSIYFNDNSYTKYSALIFISVYTDYSMESLMELFNLFEMIINDKHFLVNLTERTLV